MNKLLHSPFFWFLVAGALIFTIDARLNRPGGQIIVDDRVVAGITALWVSQMNRKPTADELHNLVNHWVNEELLFREAKRLGLDEEDTIVKRRLVQKMHFLAEESEVTEPDEAALRAYFSTRHKEYELPRRLTFSQIFYQKAPEPGELTWLNASSGDAWRRRGDASMHSPTFVRKNAREIAAEFGQQFADDLLAQKSATQWQGPLRSEFGWHHVLLKQVDEAAVPTFETVRHLVLNDYLYEQRNAAKQKQLETLKERYDVQWVVEAGAAR